MTHPDDILAQQMAAVAREEVHRARMEGVYSHSLPQCYRQQTAKTIAEGQAANRAEAQRRAALRRRVLAALTDDWQTARRIAETIGENLCPVVEALKWLHKREQVERAGTRKPLKYRRRKCPDLRA